jgi:hypothetical protein
VVFLRIHTLPERIAHKGRKLHLGREHVVLAPLVVQELPEAALGEPEAVPGRDVEVADAGVPGGLKRRLSVSVGDLVELVAERHAAEPEGELRLEDLFGSIGRGHGGASLHVGCSLRERRRGEHARRRSGGHLQKIPAVARAGLALAGHGLLLGSS